MRKIASADACQEHSVAIPVRAYRWSVLLDRYGRLDFRAVVLEISLRWLSAVFRR